MSHPFLYNTAIDWMVCFFKLVYYQHKTYTHTPPHTQKKNKNKNKKQTNKKQEKTFYFQETCKSLIALYSPNAKKKTRFRFWLI